MIKAGELAIVKTSQELVFVLEVGGVTVKVRRPIMTEHSGIIHQTDEFFLGELETKEDAFKRELAERKLMRDTLFANDEKAGKEADPQQKLFN